MRSRLAHWGVRQDANRRALPAKEECCTNGPLWIIGIDGCEPSLFNQWCDEGLLPNLAACRRSGAAGTLLSTPNMSTSAAWPTIATGANPAMHGMYNFAERVPGEYRLRLPTARDRQLPAFWELASDAGLSVVTARIPMSYPVAPINGLQVADVLAPSTHSPGFAYPESLARDLRHRFNHAFWLEPIDLMGSGRHYRIRDGLLDSVDRTFELFQFLLAREQADLFFGVVREADYGGHAFWSFHSERVSSHDPYIARDLQPALQQIYQRIDRRLGELLERLPSGANLMIISDHGMGSAPQAPQYVGPLLKAAGLMVPASSEPARPSPWRQARETISSRIPWSLRRRFRPLDEDTRSRGFTAFHMASIDLARSRAFNFLSNLTGEIWLNIEKRDRMGMVKPGAEQAELEQDIIRLFLNCRESASERPMVDRVWRRDELFHGPQIELFADLHARLDLDLPIKSIHTRFRGQDLQVAVENPPEPQLGGHRPQALFVAAGPDVSTAATTVSGALEDVAPTALAMLGVPIPQFMEGRVLAEALRPQLQYLQAPQEHSLPELPEISYTDSDLTLVEQRLTNLGYL